MSKTEYSIVGRACDVLPAVNGFTTASANCVRASCVRKLREVCVSDGGLVQEQRQ